MDGPFEFHVVSSWSNTCNCGHGDCFHDECAGLRATLCGGTRSNVVGSVLAEGRLARRVTPCGAMAAALVVRSVVVVA
jgi:hypothetical protein